MLEYDQIDISEGIDIKKASAPKECDICHYWYFLDKNFNYELYLCNGYHDLMQKAMNFNDAANVSSKGNDYRIHFWYMSKNEEVSIMQNSSLNEKTGTTYYQKNREVILNRAKDCYENNKELLRESKN